MREATDEAVWTEARVAYLIRKWQASIRDILIPYQTEVRLGSVEAQSGGKQTLIRIVEQIKSETET